MMGTARDFPEMTALLFGATSGIGLATAGQLAEAGVARIAVVGRDKTRGDQAVAAIKARGADCDVLFCAADAGVSGASADVAAKVMQHFGSIDFLMNAVPGNSPPRPFRELDLETVPALIKAHLISVIEANKAVLEPMIDRGGGVIVNIASDAAKIPTPGESVHGALMSAIAMFSRTLALETARHGIRVHALTPSIIGNTVSYERMMADPFSQRLFKKAVYRAALGLPMPEDVAATAVFLASPGAAKMTGQLITVNGGIAIA